MDLYKFLGKKDNDIINDIIRNYELLEKLTKYLTKSEFSDYINNVLPNISLYQDFLTNNEQLLEFSDPIYSWILTQILYLSFTKTASNQKIISINFYKFNVLISIENNSLSLTTNGKLCIFVGNHLNYCEKYNPTIDDFNKIVGSSFNHLLNKLDKIYSKNESIIDCISWLELFRFILTFSITYFDIDYNLVKIIENLN